MGSHAFDMTGCRGGAGATRGRGIMGSLDPHGFRRALRELGWEPACLVVAEAPLVRLMGLIPASHQVYETADTAPAMGFPRCRSIHTCFMRQPIDVAFLSAAGNVRAVWYGVAPWRVLACRDAVSVLERISPGDGGIHHAH